MYKLVITFILFVVTIAQSNNKLKLDLYIESQCPVCQQFITTQIQKALQIPEIDQITEINIYPYGNADQKKSGNQYIFTCQHGQEECYGNLIQTCALKYVTDKKLVLNYIVCLETLIDTYGNFKQSSSECAKKLKITNYNDIQNCANGKEGNQLQHLIAKATDSLNPQNQYVPWIVLNGVHNETIQAQAQSDLVNFICTYYEGPISPTCKQLLYTEIKQIDVENKVKIDLYSETLCPGCKKFITSQINAAINTTDLELISDINIHTYGNTQQSKQLNGSYQFVCQHGQQQCYGNLMMNCANKYIQKQKMLQLQVCIEKQTNDSVQINFDKSLKNCTLQLNITSVDKIQQCMNSYEGNILFHEAGVKTQQLIPPHKYIPWIVINGQHFEEIQNASSNNLVKYICNIYNGTVKVSACTQYKRTYKQVQEIQSVFLQKSYASNKIEIKLFHESKCPYCKQFITTQISKIFTYPNLLNIVDIKLYPYGNTKENFIDNKYIYTCQHGEEECNGNLIQACARYHLDNIAFVNFTICMESHVELYQTFNKTTYYCSKNLNFSFQTLSSIENCVNSDQGNIFQHQIAYRTNHLDPPHQYVPWILINNQFYEDIQDSIQDDLLKYICQFYTGHLTIPECYQFKNKFIFVSFKKHLHLKKSKRTYADK